MRLKMKNLKKIAISMFILITILSMMFLVNNQAIQDSNVDNVVEREVEIDTTMRGLTEEEYVMRLSEINKISLKDAKIKVNKTKENLSGELSIENPRLPPHHYFVEFIATNDFGGEYLVEAGAIAVVYSHGSFRGIVSIDATWTESSGPGAYTWHQSYIVAVHNGASITVRARGHIAANTTRETSYYRKTEVWEKTWYLY